MREIGLTQGLVALVDDEDYDLVSQYKWHASKRKHTYYAAHGSRTSTYLYMHRLILGVISHVDHRDGDGLNNQKRNLRISSEAQNRHNAQKRMGSSQYKGVCWHVRQGKWLASIKHEYVNYHLGAYDAEKEAAKAYNAKALELFGEFVRLNEV